MKISKFTLLPFILLLAITSGCIRKNTKKPTNWIVDYEKLSKDPYSLQLTYKGLGMLFPNAAIERLKSDERLNNIGYTLRKSKEQSLLVVIVRNLYFNDGEVDSLISLVQEGQQVLLVASNFDEKLLNRLNLTQTYNEAETDSIQKIYVTNYSQQPQAFTFRFKHQTIQQQFNSPDSAQKYFGVLGTNEKLQPDFIVFRSGKGRLMLHTAPIAFSNYFLIQGNNRDYLKYVFSFVDEPISNIYFVAINTREVSNSDWSVIWKNIATRFAFILALITLLIFILFEMKRRQRIIPVIKPNENSSVAFTETIGRLYYNNKNHTNLAEKMIQHFFEFVRSNYYLNTNVLDPEFVRLLAAKSGKDIAVTDSLIYNIKMVYNGLIVDEAFLYALYTQIQDFYNGK